MTQSISNTRFFFNYERILLRFDPQAAELLNMEDVAKRLAPDRWLTVIAAQPQLEKSFDWTSVEKKPSLYWDEQLRHQPQFASHCDFEQLKDWQIRRIQRRQPQLFSKE